MGSRGVHRDRRARRQPVRPDLPRRGAAGRGGMPPHRPAHRRARGREPRGPPRRQDGGPDRAGAAPGRPDDRRGDRRPALHRADAANRAGDAAAALARAEHVLEGTFRTGGQEHFYLETQAALAIPGEAGQITVHSSTQNPSEVQDTVAHCLGLHQNQVVCVCTRMGGGFGGKESQAAHPALLAALVASRTGRPARIVYPRDLDMRVTGKRHPYLSRYKVGFDSDGRIDALALDLYSDGGCAADLSLAVMERSMLHADNAYFIPHLAVSGTVCRTNFPSNTAMRGFGGPQGIAAIENIIEEIAALPGPRCVPRTAEELLRRRRARHHPLRPGRSRTTRSPCCSTSSPRPRITRGAARRWRGSTRPRGPISAAWR